MPANDISEKAKSIGWKETVAVWIITIGLSLGYAIVRYNVVRDVSLTNLPLFIANKAIALSATLLIGISFVMGPLARFFPKLGRHVYLRKHLGISGFALAALHAFISLAILSPAYYPRLFEKSGKLTLQGESFLLFGILAFLIFSAISITSLPPIQNHMHPKQWKTVQRLGYLAYILVLLHVGVLGYKGWGNAEAYKYGMISVSLLASIFVVFVLLLRVVVMLFPKKR